MKSTLLASTFLVEEKVMVGDGFGLNLGLKRFSS